MPAPRAWSRRAAALWTALRDRPGPVPSPASGAGFASGRTPRSAADPLAALYRHEHLVATRRETWAFYALPGVDWYGREVRAHDDLVLGGAHRLADLVDAGVGRIWLRGLRNPFPVDAFAAALDATYAQRPADSPGARTWGQLRDAACALPVAMDAHRPLTVLGVRIAARSTRREHLPLLLSDARCADHLGLVEQARLRLRDVTAAVARPGWAGAPLTPASLRWVFDASCALGLDAPPVSPPADRHTGETPGAGDPWGASGVEAVADPFAPTVELHVRRDLDAETRHVKVLRVAQIADGRDTEEVAPWLGYLSTLPAGVQWAASFDLLPGAAVKDRLEYRADVNRNLARDDEADRRRLDRHLARGIARGETALDEAAHGSREVATRAWGCVLVAVTGPDAQSAIDAAKSVRTSVARDQGIALQDRPGQYADYRRFIPAEPWDDLRHAGDLTRQTGLSLAAAVPHTTLAAGDDIGTPLGAIGGSGGDLYVFDAWGGARRDRPNLWCLVTEPGGGKTTTAALLLDWAVSTGHRTSVSSSDPMIARLVDLPHLARHAVEVPLGPASPPGVAMPSLLVPERDRAGYDDEAAWIADTRRDEAERRDFAVDMLLATLPWSVVETDRDVLPIVEAAVASVGGGYGVHSRDLIDALARESPRGADLARMLRAWAELPGGQAVFPSGDVDPAVVHAGADALLRVVTLPGITPPRGENRAAWTRAEHRSVPFLLAASRLAAVTLWADRDPKMFVADEAGITTGGLSSFAAFLLRIGYDSRKYGVSAGLAFQTMSTLSRLDDHVTSLIGAAFLGRTNAVNAAAALPLLGLPEGQGWAGLPAGFAPGEFFVSGWDDRIRRVHVDKVWWHPSLAAATETTPLAPAPRLLSPAGVAW